MISATEWFTDIFFAFSEPTSFKTQIGTVTVGTNEYS